MLSLREPLGQERIAWHYENDVCPVAMQMNFIQVEMGMASVQNKR